MAEPDPFAEYRAAEAGADRNPENADASCRLGAAARRLALHAWDEGDHAEAGRLEARAEAALERAVELNLLHHAARGELAELYLARGNFEWALRLAREAATLRGDQAAYWQTVWHCLRRTGRTDEIPVVEARLRALGTDIDLLR
jgi:hypothetical protein